MVSREKMRQVCNRLCVYELTVVTSPTRMFMGSSLKANSSAAVLWEEGGDRENE